MLRILAGAIISLGLSFLTPTMYHVHLSDIMEGFYSNHFDYEIEAHEQEYYLVPLNYSSWYAFRDGVSVNYGKALTPEHKVLHVSGIAAHELLILKSKTGYYRLEEKDTPNYYSLVRTDNLGVNPAVYLLRYLLIYMFLIIAPIALCAVFNKHVLKVARKWRLGIIAVSATLATAIVGYVYLCDWWTLFSCWVL